MSLAPKAMTKNVRNSICNYEEFEETDSKQVDGSGGSGDEKVSVERDWLYNRDYSPQINKNRLVGK